jgi:hypothetical protein
MKFGLFSPYSSLAFRTDILLNTDSFTTLKFKGPVMYADLVHFRKLC